IRILRMQEQSFTEISSVSVGGTNIYANSTGDPSVIEIESDPTKVTLYSVEPGNTVVVTYKNVNVEESTTPIVDMPILYEIDELTYERVEVLSGYTVSLGLQTANSNTVSSTAGGNYNYASGHWVAGLDTVSNIKNKTKFTNTVTLTTVSDFPIGRYELVFYIGGGANRVEHVIKLSRVESTEANILTIVPEYGTATKTNNTYYTTIPFGYYYDEQTFNANDALGTGNANYDQMIAGTKVLDFSDIWTDSFGPVLAADLEAGLNVPEYLKSLTISSFGVLKSVELVKTGDSYVTWVNDLNQVGDQSSTYYRKRYTVKLTVRAEAYDPLDPDKVPEMVYYHHLTEASVSLDLVDSRALNTPSKSGIYFTPNKVTNDDLTVNYYEEFVREENPTYNYLHDYSMLYLSTSNTLLERGLTIYTDKEYQEDIDFIYDQTTNGFNIRYFSGAPIGNYVYNASYEFTFLHRDIDSPFYNEEFEWSRIFIPVVTSKAGSKISRLETLSFTSETAMATINTIMYPSSMLVDSQTGEVVPMNAELYYNVLTGEPGYPKVINILYGNIDYSNQAVSRSENIFYTVGQVSKTNLEYYSPTFGLPAGAVIARRIPVYNELGEIISFTEYIYNPNDEDSDISVLNDNFFPLEDEEEFNYIYYRVYAEGYVASVPGLDTLYTDYYIAVIDTSNNAFFTFEVFHSTEENVLDMVYLMLKLFGIPEGSSNTTPVELLEFAFFSFFSKENPTDEYYGQYGVHNSQKGSGSGTFYVDIIMPHSYEFIIYLNGVLQVDESDKPTTYFEIPHSVIPVRYTVTIEIIPNSGDDNWGQGGIVS
ncbi:hypothetical protein LJC17_01520, partial [Acholeplasma sp. OttesenSCG-928-E16]|nr:hypothetical protein [Acholeplasma sp. OttesenSCG-928-E16]